MPLHEPRLMLSEEAGACLLCSPAPCTAACPYGLDPAWALRAVRFENKTGAALRLPRALPCDACADKPCLPACAKRKVSRGIAIDQALQAIHAQKAKATPKSDLGITFCGIACENPFFLSSSIVANHYEMISRAFAMGWAGAALKTIGLFTPNEVSPRFDAVGAQAAPFYGFKNIEQTSEKTAVENFSCIRRLKKEFPAKVIIASIMGRDEDEWTLLSQMAQEAGADIIECNFSCPHMAKNGLGSDVGQNPELVAAYVRAVRKGASIPVLAKMTPNLGNMEPPAIAAMEAGATGIAAINTVKSVMNVNLHTFASGPDVRGQSSVGGYSGRAVKPIALRFIQSLKSHPALQNAPISGMGGIETWRDAAEFIALGCENVQVTTAVMQYGYRIIDDLIEGMRLYLDNEGISLPDLVGRALPHVVAGDDLDRATICYPKFDRARCAACGRCFISCRDGGHQAIKQGADGRPSLDGKRCVGCHLCVTVCPAQAIAAGTCVPKAADQQGGLF